MNINITIEITIIIYLGFYYEFTVGDKKFYKMVGTSYHRLLRIITASTFSVSECTLLAIKQITILQNRFNDLVLYTKYVFVNFLNICELLFDKNDKKMKLQ